MTDTSGFRPIGDILDDWTARQDRERFRAHQPGEPEHPNDRLARIVRLLDIDIAPEALMLIERGDAEWLVDQVISLRSELEHIAECEPAHRARIRALLNGDTT